jgi:putative ABC transport system permease protein
MNPVVPEAGTARRSRLLPRLSFLGQAGSTLSIAVTGILTNKARTGLTLLGMIIGVASVIVAVGIGNGSAARVTNQLNALGTNLVQVQPGATTSGGVRGAFGSASTLTVADAQTLADNAGSQTSLPDVAVVAPEFSTNVQVVAGSQNTNTSADGVSPEYLGVRDAQVASGRFISGQDLTQQAQVVDLGASVVTTLFTDPASAVGSTITLGGMPFQVIGVMTSKGGSGGRNQDDTIFIPLTTAEYLLPHSSGSNSSLSLIDVEATQATTTNQAQAEVEAMLRNLHQLTYNQSDDFSFFSQTSIQQTASDVSGTLTTLLAAVSACSLLVAGIGIMNIMLVSVTERTREVGLRKAVGAKRNDILLQFLAEAMVLSVIGGALGVACGVGGAQLITPLLGGTKALVTPQSVGLALAVSLAIGIFFGLYPANRAARLNPIDALRYE